MLVTAALLLHAHVAVGHAVFMSYIEHRAKAVVGPSNIDITIDLTFFEIRSMAERRRMDADRDGRISPEETASYLARMDGSVSAAVRLLVDDRPVDVVPLFNPTLDLLGTREVAPSHLLLRLFYFARTPSWIKAGSRIVIEDTLWPQAAALRTFEASGIDGFQISTETLSDPLSSVDTGPHRFRGQCTSAPERIVASSAEDDAARAGMRVPAPPPLPKPWAGSNSIGMRSLTLPLVPCAVLVGVFVFRFTRRHRQESGHDAQPVTTGKEMRL